MKLAVYASAFRSDSTATLTWNFITGALAQGHFLTLATTTVDALLAKGFSLESVDGWKIADQAPTSVDADFIVSLGGDGTFLRAARWSGDSGVPVAGVNLGHLGYLPSFNPDDLPHLAAWLENGRYNIEERSLLRVEIPEVPHTEVWPYALNEVALLKQDTASMITMPVSIDGKPMATYRADGLIIATPTGSTGYNLSVGGPILQPTVPAFVISPIADHSLTMRPMVIGNESKLEITASGGTPEYRVSLDGNSFTLPAHTPLKISKAPFTCRVVMKEGSVFALSLRSKLLWGESSIRHDDGAGV